MRKKGASISFHAVQNQRLSGRSTASKLDDFVDGKGRGVIILLSGSTGVGKILMAESIAETMEVFLYTLSTGEIGIVPSTRNQSST
jgi:ATP-dependent Lon protease